MSNAKYRVLVDWNKDGWFDWGVGEDTPLNLVPDAIWGVNNVMNFDFKDQSTFARLEKKYAVSDYGFSSITNEGVSGEDYYLGFRGFQDYQMNDLVNKDTPLMGGVSSLNYDRDGALQRRIDKGRPSPFFSEPLVYKSVVTPITSYSLGRSGLPLFSVTPGQTYTFRLLPRVYYYESSPTPVTFEMSILKQSGITVVATTGSVSVTPTIDLTFTAPGDMTGMRVSVVITNSGSEEFENFVDGFQLYSGSPASGDMYACPVDPDIAFNEEQFDVVIDPSVSYNMSVFTRETENITAIAHSHDVSVFVCPIGDNTYTELTPISVTPVFGEWTRLSFEIPPQADRSGIFMHINVSDDTYHEFAGLQVTEGASLAPFNTGNSVALYENITSYVKDIKWKLGKDKFEGALPSDGEAQLVLNNASRIFSPNNSDSPLYGLMDRGLKVIIQTRWLDTDTWDTRWQGFTDTYEVDPGEFGQRETLLRAVQGVDRMRNSKLWFLTEEDADFADVVQTMVNESGWISAHDVATSLVGFQTFVDINAYVSDPDANWETIEPGVKTVDFLGFGWNEETSAHDALTDLISSQNAHLFVNREGKLELYNRERFINVWLNFDHEIDMNDQPDVTYQYGEDIVNSVSVTIQGKRAVPSSELWANRRAIRITSGGRREIVVNYQFDDGASKTPIDIDTEIEVDVYDTDPGLTGTVTPIPPSANLSSLAIVELTTDGSNRTILKITNKLPHPAWFMVRINGTAVDRGDNETAVIEDDKAIEELNELQKTTMNNKLISTFEEAEAAAWTLLGRRSTPSGEFDSFAFYIQDEDTYNLLNDIKVADRIVVSEYQTGEEDLQHMILQEEGNINSGGLMKVTYRLTRTDQTKYLYAEATIESKYDNLIYDVPINPIFDGSVIPVNDVYRLLDTGIYGIDFYIGATPLDMSHELGEFDGWYSSSGGQPGQSSKPEGFVYTASYVGADRNDILVSKLRPIGFPISTTDFYTYWMYSGGSLEVHQNSLLDFTYNTATTKMERDKAADPDAGSLYYYHLKITSGLGQLMRIPSNSNFITLDSSKTYTVALYARPADGFAAESYTLEALDNDRSVITSDSLTFTPGIIDVLSLTFTGETDVCFRISKDEQFTRHKLFVYGFKLVEGSVAPSDYANIPNPDFLDIFV